MAGVSFSWPIRVYHEDTDGGGVVYHSNYLNFMERARTEWLRDLGFGQNELKAELNMIIVVHALSIDYHHPARFDDTLIVLSELTKTGRSSFEFEQKITCNELVLTTSKVRLVCVDSDKFKPVAIPQAIKLKMI
ncbi:MAG: tol-pal system-associated acyl-CoA thioesterase [Methylophilaceae bacterium]|nr:tol-pal system-associated acyl-CoA thioesterase [Methylophilaceae bacterium]